MVRKKRKKKTKYNYYYIYEPICECLKCGHEHLRKQRKKIVSKDEPEFLSILVCPKCGKEGYVLIGDREFKRREKREE